MNIRWTTPASGLLVLVSGLLFSSGALAGGHSGAITFVATSSSPALSVPTLGVMAAVMLAGVLLVVALRVLHKNHHTFASLAFVGVAVTAAVSVASMGSVQAVPTQVNVTASELEQPLTFGCGGAGSIVTEFRNGTEGNIAVVAVTTDPTCSLYGSTTCLPTELGGPTELAPGDTCLVEAGPE